MGAGARQRGDKVIRERLASENQVFVEFEIMDRLNALEKSKYCTNPREPILFRLDNGGWLVNLESDPYGYGFLYKTLNGAVMDWEVVIVGYDDGVWRGVPIDSIKAGSPADQRGR